MDMFTWMYSVTSDSDPKHYSLPQIKQLSETLQYASLSPGSTHIYLAMYPNKIWAVIKRVRIDKLNWMLDISGTKYHSIKILHPEIISYYLDMGRMGRCFLNDVQKILVTNPTNINHVHWQAYILNTCILYTYIYLNGQNSINGQILHRFAY